MTDQTQIMMGDNTGEMMDKSRINETLEHREKRETERRHADHEIECDETMT